MSHSHQSSLIKLLGDTPVDSSVLRARQRFHQGWWRAFVLGLEPGPHAVRSKAALGATTCNTLPEGATGAFLTEAAERAYKEMLIERTAVAHGIVDKRRMRSNLLSSQPMAFNLFGELAADLEMAAHWLRAVVPDVQSVDSILFEYQPELGSIGDNSAFDVAVQYHSSQGLCLLGIEVKYTDDFSARDKHNRFYGQAGNRNEPSYRAAFSRCEPRFPHRYETYVENSRTNQLFRNVLMAESARAAGQYVNVATALLCHPDDASALAAGEELKSLLGDSSFEVLTLWNVIEALQLLPITPAQREWTMLFWARYLGVGLSEAAFEPA